MKKLCLLLIICLFAFGAKGQSQISKDTADYPYWIEMMQNDTVNFFAVQKAFYKYYDKHHNADKEKKREEEFDKQGKGEEEEENEGFELFKRWEYLMLRRINPDGSRMPADQAYKEFIRYNANKSPSAIKGGAVMPGSNPTGNWTSIGPATLPKNLISQPNGMGRINAIAFDPSNKGTIYAGSPGGGLWVTTDSGNTWTAKTDALATLGVSSIAIDPSSSSTIYIGTGDRDNADAPGIGVMKSTNSGPTWSSANSGMGNVTISKLLINPSSTSTLIAATSGGIFRSTNSGGSWTKTSSNSAYYKDMVFKPKHPNVVYATANGDFYRSTNGGASFTQISSGLSSAYRGVIGVTVADTNRVYFVTTGSTVFNASYVSTNGGSSFRTKSTTPNIMDYSDNGSGTGGQAWYDLCVAVDTANKGTLYVGGVNIFKSTDSGSSWTVVAHWVGSGVPAIHADQHVFAINPLNNKLYVGNDGGLYYTANGGSAWKDISSGMAISEMYKIGQSGTRQDLMLAGFQDNGTCLVNNNKWSSIFGGDGMECAIDYNDTLYQYAEIYYGDIYRSTNGGKTFYDHVGGNGTASINEGGDWVTPYVLSKSNPGTMFAGYHNLWRSTNIKASSPSWSKISSSLASSNSYLIEVTEQSAADTGIFYLSRSDNRLFLSTNINSSTPSWTDLTSSLPNSNSLVVEVKTHPKYPNTVYIIQNQNVYLSNNKGSSWTKITGTLPSVAKNTIAIDKNSWSGLYIGTDAGSYYRDSSMSDWTSFYNGLPAAARVMEMEIYYDPVKSANNKIKAGTYGRGAWVSDLYTPVAPVAAFTINNANQCLTGNSFTFTDGTTITSGTVSSWLWDFGDLSSTSSSQNPKHSYAKPGTYTVKLISTSSLGTTDNISKTVTVYPQFVPSFSSSAISQCLKGNSFSFTDKSTISSGSTSSWDWDFGDLSTHATKQNPSYSYSNSGVYKVVLKVTSNNGCTDTVSQSIKVNPMPVSGYALNYTAHCLSGNSFSFTDKSTISLGSLARWSWDFGNGDTSAKQSPTYSYAAAGTYTVRLKIFSNTGCTDTISKRIIVNPQPKAAFTINSTAQCLGINSFTFTDKSTISSGAVNTWNWDFGDGLGKGSTSQSPSYIYASAGSFRVKFTATSNNGCVDTISKVMLVFPKPVTSFGVNSNAQCLNANSFTFKDNTTVSAGGISAWTWDFGDGAGLGSTKQNPSYSYTTPGTYSVKMVIKTNYSCIDSITNSVTVYPQSKPSFTVNNAAQCLAGNNFTFTDKSTISGATITGWLWDFGDTKTDKTQNPSHSFLSPGSYKIILKLTTTNGCTDTLSKMITVYPQPVAVYSTNKVSACFRANSFVFTDKSTISSGSVSNWNWDYGDKGASTSQNPTHNYSGSGSFRVRLKVTSNFGCTDTLSKLVTVYPQPVAAFSSSDTGLCFSGNNFTFSDKSTLSSGTINTWVWNNGDGTTSQSTQNQKHSFLKPGSYQVKLNITSNNGCTDSTISTIKVFPVNKPVITGDTVICSGTSGSYKTLSNTGSTYAWKVSGGSIISGTGSNAIVVKWPKFAGAIISVIETNSFGCKDSASKSFVIKPAPTAFMYAPGKICAGSVLNFKDSSQGSAKYIWNFGDTSSSAKDTSSVQNPAHSYTFAGKYTVSLKVATSLGCKDSTTRSVVVNPKPDASFTYGFSGKQTIFRVKDSSLTDPSYNWTFGDGNVGTGHRVSHTYPKNKIFAVKLNVLNGFGCTSELDSNVNVLVSGIDHFENNEIKLDVYPNPFHNNTSVSYELIKSSKVKLSLYDITGKEISALLDENQASGKYLFEIQTEKYHLMPGEYYLMVLINGSYISRHLVKF